MKSLLITGFLMALMLGCSQSAGPTIDLPNGKKEKKVENKPVLGVFSVRISPPRPKTSDTLLALIQKQMVRGIPPELRYQWLKNGDQIPDIASNQLPNGFFGKGDLISVQISDPKGGKNSATLVSEPVMILNSPPQVLSASFVPSDPKGHQRIELVIEGLDLDQDSLEFLSQWVLNDQKINGETSSLEPSFFKKGDRIRVEVKAFDGEEEGEPYQSPPITILNTPPNITSAPPFSMGENGEYQYQINAEDPDGDNIFFEMVKGPEGMVVDPQRGALTWKPSPDDIGTHSIEIAAVDPERGRGIQKYDLEIFALEAAVK